MSSLMSDSSLDKAALTVTEVKGAEDFRMWFASIRIALDHSRKCVEGPDATAPEARSLADVGSLNEKDPSKLDPTAVLLANYCQVCLAHVAYVLRVLLLPLAI